MIIFWQFLVGLYATIFIPWFGIQKLRCIESKTAEVRFTYVKHLTDVWFLSARRCLYIGGVMSCYFKWNWQLITMWWSNWYLSSFRVVGMCVCEGNHFTMSNITVTVRLPIYVARACIRTDIMFRCGCLNDCSCEQIKIFKFLTYVGFVCYFAHGFHRSIQKKLSLWLSLAWTSTDVISRSYLARF